MSQSKIQQWGLWRAPGARSQTLWPLAKAGVSPTSRLSFCGSLDSLRQHEEPGPALTPTEGPPWRVLPAHCPTSHSPSASSPWTPGCRPSGCRRGAQPPSAAGCARWSWFSGDSSWRSWPSLLSGRATQRHQPVGRTHPMSVMWFLIPPKCLARSPAVKAAALFSAQPGAQRSARILKLTQESILIPANPNAGPGGPGGSSRTRH